MTGDAAPAPRGRVVAIVGRPNVGKSAIFNRLAGKRIAIVHAESGVTRDRLAREVEWEDDRFELVDTGGIANVDRSSKADVIEKGIRSQVEAALQDASAAILVVDIEVGLMPLDAEVAAMLRTSGCKTYVAANKADTAARDEAASEFTRLGFPVYPVSALHNRGFGELMEAATEALPESTNKSAENPLRVAIVGRPNAGKSSYINRLLRNERVLVSDIPGTTRDSIDVAFQVGHGEQARHYVLVDTAGMRRKGKIKDSVERYGRYRAEEALKSADVVVLMLDTEQGPTSLDKHIAAQAISENKGLVLLVNKWDLSETTQTQYGPELVHCMPFVGYCPVVFVSAKSGYNIRRSVDAIDYVAAQTQTTLPTGVLNRVLLDAQSRVRAPAVRGKAVRIYYATQVGTGPLRVRIFVNNPKCVTEPYRKYLVKALREAFGLEGAPVVLHFRARREIGGKRK